LATRNNNLSSSPESWLWEYGADPSNNTQYNFIDLTLGYISEIGKKLKIPGSILICLPAFLSGTLNVKNGEPQASKVARIPSFRPSSFL
jgi:hypothetical protein